MPSNPLRKILDRRRGERGNPSEEALEKLERGIRESRESVRRRNREIARGYFDDSVEALRRGLEESRATLEGLPGQVPGGEEESFRAFVGELMEGYARIEKALDEAAKTAPDADAEETEDSEDSGTDGDETGETRPDGDATGAEAPTATEEVGEPAEDEAEEVGETVEDAEETPEDAAVEVVGVAEQAVGGEDAQAPRASDAARRRAQDLGVDLSEVEGTGSGGAITVRDVNKLVESSAETTGGFSDRALEGLTAATDGSAEGDGLAEGNGEVEADGEAGDGPRATNAARRRAEELGIDLAGIRGSGAGGLITIQDVVRL